MARLQQMRMQRRRAAAMQQMAMGGYPAGAAQGQQYAMQATPPTMPMGQMIQAPQQAQYAQQPHQVSWDVLG